MLGALERFLHVESASGIVLLAAALIAIGWANSPWHESYQALLHLPLGVQLGPASFNTDLHFVVNDILMVVFFFVVGLEIRLEMYRGVLADRRRALLPLVAALGGVLVPAAIYLGFNAGRVGEQGWGIPMATDIAFAVGVLTVLGDRVNATTRIILLAIAIIDDIAAIAVIALVYSENFNAGGLLIALGGVAMVFGMQRVGVRSPWLFIIPGVLIWFGALDGGVHPTVAGVLLGVMTPAWAWLDGKGFMSIAASTITTIKDKLASDAKEEDLLDDLERIRLVSRESVSPAMRIEDALHPWVAFIILPLFALMNAGVDIRGLSLEAAGAVPIILGILTGLVIGKPLGMLTLTWLANRAGWVQLPEDMRWTDMLLIGCVSGIGFTMSLFIGNLAFGDGERLELAKAAILAASALAAVIGIGVALRWPVNRR